MLNKSAEQTFDCLERGDIGVWDVIELYKGHLDVHGLEAVLECRPHLASNVLYIISELPSTRIMPIWRSVIPYLTGSDLNCVFYALDAIHGIASDAPKDEILSAISSVNTSDKSIVEKLTLIRDCVS
jgi:hypothetical protein